MVRKNIQPGIYLSILSNPCYLRGKREGVKLQLVKANASSFKESLSGERRQATIIFELKGGGSFLAHTWVYVAGGRLKQW